MVLDRDGAVMRSAPYLQYAAYLQARKGGLISETFPQAFWNLPFTLREDAGIPQSRGVVPWVPQPHEVADFLAYYDHVLLRSGPRAASRLQSLPGFHHELIFEKPPWRLFRAPSR
jgi:hypothetical protein